MSDLINFINFIQCIMIRYIAIIYGYIIGEDISFNEPERLDEKSPFNQTETTAIEFENNSRVNPTPAVIIEDEAITNQSPIELPVEIQSYAQKIGCHPELWKDGKLIWLPRPKLRSRYHGIHYSRVAKKNRQNAIEKPESREVESNANSKDHSNDDDDTESDSDEEPPLKSCLKKFNRKPKVTFNESVKLMIFDDSEDADIKEISYTTPIQPPSLVSCLRKTKKDVNRKVHFNDFAEVNADGVIRLIRTQEPGRTYTVDGEADLDRVSDDENDLDIADDNNFSWSHRENEGIEDESEVYYSTYLQSDLTQSNEPAIEPMSETMNFLVPENGIELEDEFDATFDNSDDYSQSLYTGTKKLQLTSIDQLCLEVDKLTLASSKKTESNEFKKESPFSKIFESKFSANGLNKVNGLKLKLECKLKDELESEPKLIDELEVALELMPQSEFATGFLISESDGPEFDTPESSESSLKSPDSQEQSESKTESLTQDDSGDSVFQSESFEFDVLINGISLNSEFECKGKSQSPLKCKYKPKYRSKPKSKLKDFNKFKLEFDSRMKTGFDLKLKPRSRSRSQYSKLKPKMNPKFELEVKPDELQVDTYDDSLLKYKFYQELNGIHDLDITRLEIKLQPGFNLFNRDLTSLYEHELDNTTALESKEVSESGLETDSNLNEQSPLESPLESKDQSTHQSHHKHKLKPKYKFKPQLKTKSKFKYCDKLDFKNEFNKFQPHLKSPYQRFNFNTTYDQMDTDDSNIETNPHSNTSDQMDIDERTINSIKQALNSPLIIANQLNITIYN